MSILFTDLDNTLIFSHHRKIGKPKIVVEYMDGREQSFMTRFSYDFFAAADYLRLIPVTTRTEKQFRRIVPPEPLAFPYAILCNGGKLLVNGEKDEAWSKETESIAEKNYDSLEEATDRLIRLCKYDNIHRPVTYMRYVKSSDAETVYEEIKKCVDPERVTVQRDGKKIYLFTHGVSKGSAIHRFMQGRGRELMLAAGDVRAMAGTAERDRGLTLAMGDGRMDISMLDAVDYAFSGRDIYEDVTNENNTLIYERVISDVVCERLGKMRESGIL